MKKKEGENLSEEAIRIKELIEGTGMSLREYARFIGVSTTVLHNFIAGRNNISYAILKAVLTSVPKLNVKWVMFGIGDKYTNVDTSQQHALDLMEMKVQFLGQQIRDKEEIISTLKSTIEKIKQ